jgi:hypothetical protein
MNRNTGKLFFKVNGTRYDAKGEFSYNLGKDKKTRILGADGVHGAKVEPVIPFIEGKITDNSDLDLAAFIAITGTITLELQNGKTIMLSDADYAADADVTTEEGEIPVRFEGSSCEEV